MKTLALFSDSKLPIPAATAWYLDSLGQFRGKQELYTRQSPQKLRILREHAIIESAVSSNRIEGVSVDPSRVQNVLIASKPLFRDRDEEEIRGYRDALAWIHDHSSEIPLDESTFKSLHAMAREHRQRQEPPVITAAASDRCTPEARSGSAVAHH